MDIWKSRGLPAWGPCLNLRWIRDHERKYPPLQATRKGKSLTKKNIKNSMHIIVGRSSKLPPCVSREWLRRCLVALLKMAEETGASINWWCLLPKRLVLTVCNTSGWEWSWSKWFWYFCQLFANSKMHLPIASEICSQLAPRSGSGQRWHKEGISSSGQDL